VRPTLYSRAAVRSSYSGSCEGQDARQHPLSSKLISFVREGRSTRRWITYESHLQGSVPMSGGGAQEIE
jgi:hypothetical protein